MTDELDPLRDIRPDRVLPDDPPDPEVLAREKARLMSTIAGAPAAPEERRMPSIYPRLAYRDEVAAREFLVRAFGLVERREARMELPGGTLAWLELGDGVVMIGRSGDERHGLHSPQDAGVTTAMVNVYVRDIDAHYAHAQTQGAQIVMELEDMFWGDRRYEALDLEGHRWHFGERLTVDPFDARPPTSHERMSGRPWDASYTEDQPAPWDIGRAQPALARVIDAGAFTGTVLDAGCGTGEHALLIASGGARVVGLDAAATAIARARAKATERGIDVEFVVGDALHLERLGRTFDAVLDCGLFHSFEGDERTQYVASLASVTAPGATLHLLCFSDAEPGMAPHPVSRAELANAFATERGWRIDALEAERIHTNIHADGVPAWLATIRRR